MATAGSKYRPDAPGANFLLAAVSNFLSFCLAQKERKQRKRAPYITIDGKKNAIELTRGVMPLGLKAAPTGVQNCYPAVLFSALHK